MDAEQKMLDHWMGTLRLAALLRFAAFALPESEHERMARLTEEAKLADDRIERVEWRHAILREEGLA